MLIWEKGEYGKVNQSCKSYFELMQARASGMEVFTFTFVFANRMLLCLVRFTCACSCFFVH